MALVLPHFRPKWDIHGAGPSLEEVMPKAGQLIEGDPNVIAGTYHFFFSFPRLLLQITQIHLTVLY